MDDNPQEHGKAAQGIQVMIAFGFQQDRRRNVAQLSQSRNGSLENDDWLYSSSITTAVPLESTETERINSFVSGLVRREVVLTAKVDESIIGGLVIQIGDRLLDGSTKARLDGLRNRLHTQIAASA